MKNFLLTLLCVATLAACRKGDPVLPSTAVRVAPKQSTTSTEVEVAPKQSTTGQIYGFYLLNEGNMGSNKASLDYYDYTTGIYHRNIYGERNPKEIKDLGDVGNDIQIYGDKLYAVINCSNYLEVMDVATAEHITKIAIPNCRYVVFSGRYAYVSAYAGAVQINKNARIGYVAKIDTATLKVVGECTVGYQPEEMAVVENRLYVANSGGYRVPNYDRTVSVIDLESFTETKKIDVAINLHRIEPDNYGNLYVSSRGDYYKTSSKTYIIDTRTDVVTDCLEDLPNSNMALCGDSLYVYSTEWNYNKGESSVTYAIVDTRTKKIVTRNFIKDGTHEKITIPYGIAVNSQTREFFVTDAKDYVSPGTLYCFGEDGTKKWSVTTGDIPAHIVFSHKKLKDAGKKLKE